MPDAFQHYDYENGVWAGCDPVVVIQRGTCVYMSLRREVAILETQPSSEL